jgi:hypothetical protein
VLKRTRPAEFLRKKAVLRAKQQRAVDKQMRQLVTWGRSR